ncbi:MAG TPA: phenylalanine--tRNA ligase subunit beta [Phycisphaerales bacterium]|nr:phenylalanine--tRNA ligase subunit beta [Phycisphaerales bacterium]
MNISLKWLNRYLSPGDVSVEEAEHVLTFAGYPIESIEHLPSGDVALDVEITSNRGDLLSHVGCAREIAAARSAFKPRTLKLPEFVDPTPGAPIGDDLKLINREPEACPLFTARLIRGVKVGPSPAWLVELLEAVGQRSINAVVDVTNFITFELGNPCHVFDLAKLAGHTLDVRYAREGESLTTLDGKTHKLVPADLVVADAEKPTSLAGIMGGKDSEVDESTTDVVFEMATWDPVTVRTAARRLAIRTDASHRFERIVDPRTIEDAARRAVALLCELTGGELASGVLSEGKPLETTTPIRLRPERCSKLIGVQCTAEQIKADLEGHSIAVEIKGDHLECTPPPFRPDLEREIDLIEEVVRTIGFAGVPQLEKIEVAVTHPQESERARREITRVLTGLGFYETVTFSFVSPAMAQPWLGQGLEMVGVDDERRGGEPILRPSVIPSLLTCRRANAAGQVRIPGGVRLYELSAVFAQTPDRQSCERRMLTLLMDVEGVAPGKRAKAEQIQSALRAIRGAAEHLGRAMAGSRARVTVEPCAPEAGGWATEAFGRVLLDGEPIGVLGLVDDAGLTPAGLDQPVVAAEFDLDRLIGLFPPVATVESLPAFPSIERDLSLVLKESTPWAKVESLVGGANLENFESLGFVGVFRGKTVGSGRKSVTLRLGFRRPDGTLRHEDVDPQVNRLVDLAKDELGAVLRT